MQIEENKMPSEGSFSAVSTAKIARVGAFFQIFRDLQYSKPFAPLQTQFLQNFNKTQLNTVHFLNFQIFQYFSLFLGKSSKKNV